MSETDDVPERTPAVPVVQVPARLGDVAGTLDRALANGLLISSEVTVRLFRLIPLVDVGVRLVVRERGRKDPDDPAASRL